MTQIDNQRITTLFGEFIRRNRKKQHISQKEFADKLNLTQSYISHIERGKREVDFPTALMICATLDVDLNEFIVSLKRTPPKVIRPKDRKTPTE